MCSTKLFYNPRLDLQDSRNLPSSSRLVSKNNDIDDGYDDDGDDNGEDSDDSDDDGDDNDSMSRMKMGRCFWAEDMFPFSDLACHLTH